MENHPRIRKEPLIILAIPFLIGVVLVVVSLFGNQPHVSATQGATELSLALNSNGVPAQTVVGTNIQSATDLVPVNGIQAQASLQLLQDWNHPLVRLHLGFRGETTTTLPEATQGRWNFTQLDALIALLRSRNIAFFLNVRTAPPWMFTANGQLPDQQFADFATYMARLVSWYNKGGFTDDQGIFHASGHHDWVHIWEIWNEPKSASDIPVSGVNRNVSIWMQPERYAHLYDMTVDAMRAVDPTIITGGPALGSWADENNFYLQRFVQAEHAPLDFLSFHFYAATSQTEPDVRVLSEVTGARFLARLTANRQLLDKLRPGQHIPIWITELNVDETSFLPVDPRGTSPFAYAFLANAMATAEEQGVGLVDQFFLQSDAQYGLLDSKTAQSYRTAWFYRLFAQEFPPGSTLLPMHLASQADVVGLALITPDKTALHILLGNIQTAEPADVNGSGVSKRIHLTLLGNASPRRISAKSLATIWSFDAQTSPQSMPTSHPLNLIIASNNSVTVDTMLGVYGAAIISIPLR